MADSDDHGVVREEYDPATDESLSVRVVEAIEAQTDRDLTGSGFVLYDDVDPDALDDLFRADSSTNTRVQFETGGVTVSLWGNGTVEIAVSDRTV